MEPEQDYDKATYIEQLEGELQNKNTEIQGKEAKITELHTAYSGVAAGAAREGNLIQYQLDSVEMLDKLEHFYRGDYVGVEDGNQVWKIPDNKELITLNEFGVSAMMEIVTKYIDKNTALSYYSEERIYEIMGDLGDDLVLFILCNYEKMGMDTYFKKTKFRIIITSTLHIIESTYRRAIHGRTSDKLNESRIITQSDISGHVPPMQAGKRKFSWINPSTWGK